MDPGSDWYQDVEALEAHLARPRKPRAAPPEVAGYDVLSEIRRGGQGVVYFGRQRSTRRAVAIKVMTDQSLTSAAARRRFEREIDLVGSLRHPNVVTVYDSGETTGRDPYFVMEFVDGVPLDEWIQHNAPPRRVAQRPSVRAVEPRLNLFLKICAAVAHAHQHGVIHRDLKPSNVLIDEAGEPRVLDFGVARSTTDASSRPVGTSADAFLGTLAYASPEHVRDGVAAVDARSDVYALGLILHEMLTGCPPYAISGPVGSVVRSILEVEPLPPSRLSPASNADLDAIVLKALSKDPSRRYQSADALAEDVRRCGQGEAVLARRDGALYVLGKLVRRHKSATALAVALLLAMTGFSVGMTVLYRRATIESQTTRQIRVFLEDTLASVTPAESGRDVTMREVLNEAVHWVDLALADQPEVQSSVRHTLANSFRVVGDLDSAETQLNASLTLRRAHFGDESLEVAQSLGLMGLLHLDRGDLDTALSTLHEALDLRRRLLGPDHPDVALTLQVLAAALSAAGKPDEAEHALREAVRIATRAYGPDHADAWMPQFRLAEALARRGASDESEALHRLVLDGRRTNLPTGHPDVERSILALGEHLRRTGRFEEAEPLLRECLESRQHRLPLTHPLISEAQRALDSCRSSDGGPASPRR